QGGVDIDLRLEMGAELSQLPFDGFGIGGLSIGESREETWPALTASISSLPEGRPRYLMGVGDPEDMVEAIRRGVDLFDCVLPTRLGRTGTVLTSGGRRDLLHARFRYSDEPIDRTCTCPVCARFSLAYLHHLFRSGAELGMRLAR